MFPLLLSSSLPDAVGVWFSEHLVGKIALVTRKMGVGWGEMEPGMLVKRLLKSR